MSTPTAYEVIADGGAVYCKDGTVVTKETPSNEWPSPMWGKNTVVEVKTVGYCINGPRSGNTSGYGNFAYPWFEGMSMDVKWGK